MLIKNNLKSNSPIKKKYNLGLGLLKVVLAFSVIVSHIFKKKSTNNKFLLYLLKGRRIHVPSFFIMSFYFMYNDLIILNINKIKIRFERLFIPYFFWPIIIWIINNILKFIFKIKISSTLKDLKNQLLWGNIFIIQFWFLWDLIMITLLFIIFIFLLKGNSLFYLQLLGIISYVLQYSGINKRFYQYLSVEKRECLGRIAEMIPFSVTGFTFAYYQIINELKINKIKTCIFSFIIFYFIEKYNIFIMVKGIAYSGIKLNIHSISLIFLFSIFPTEKITNNLIINFLTNITKYTGGVFYLHWSIFCYLRNFVRIIHEGNFIGCIIIYLLCYIISFIGNKCFKNIRFKFLFS